MNEVFYDSNGNKINLSEVERTVLIGRVKLACRLDKFNSTQMEFNGFNKLKFV